MGTTSITDWAYCRDCRRKHGIRATDNRGRADAWSDWLEKHRGHRVGIRVADPGQSYGHNTDFKEAFQTEQTMTVTNLHSLASSVSAGWSSASVDNTSNLYLDALVQVVIAAVNTAPANSKAIFVFAFGGTNSSDLTTTGTSGGTVGTEGSLTFPDITTLPVLMPRIGVIPYPVQNKSLVSPPFSVAKAFGGILPPYWGVAILNHAGFTLAASGNTVKYRGVYGTGL